MAVQPNGPTGTWTLTFADEFDDTTGMSGPTNGLAASKWNCGWYSGPTSPGVGDTLAVTDPINSSTAAYFGPASIVFPGDGAVHLRLQNGVDAGGSHNGRTKESGLITTAGLIALNPGSVPVSTSNPDLRPYVVDGPCVLEFRVRIPGPNGSATQYWPGIFLTNAGNYGGTNPSGAAWPGQQNYLEEIDLIEWFGGGSLGSSSALNFHAASSYAASGIPASLLATDLSLAYHTYTYQFTATTLQVWVDGLPVAVSPTAAQVMAQWTVPQYLLFDFQSNTGASLPTTAASTPSDFMIDYVRVWNTPITYSDYKNTIEPNLVAALSANNLLNTVALLGPDTASANDSWVISSSADLKNTLMGYVRQDFPAGTAAISSDGRETAANSLLTGISANDNSNKPVMTLIADGALGPGGTVTGYQYGVEMADFAVQLARAGMAGIIAYLLDDDMHGTEWGMWQITQDTGQPRPWFFPWSVLSNANPAGSTIYAPAQPTTNDFRVLAAQTPQGGWTFVLVNRLAATRNVQLSVPFAPTATTTFSQYIYSEAIPLFVDSNGSPLPSGTVQAVLARGFTVQMAGNSVLLLTQQSSIQTNVFNVKRPPLQKRR